MQMPIGIALVMEANRLCNVKGKEEEEKEEKKEEEEKEEEEKEEEEKEEEA